MDPNTEIQEDPLIAALPPATDYMTYLTLLEYQLKPENLSTLNRLLIEDDGKLASEIGWDLLKLVLPMLQIVPQDANKCLSIIARRGNPREVVVRVAEELERLGEHEEDDNGDEEDALDEDGLPTFAGEAPRIHLGEMKLDGMPAHKEQLPVPKSTESAQGDRRASVRGEYGSDDVLILQALLSMLSILHPRIKTQYPSRFLATSLPAALSAYRRMRITPETTLAFIDFLAKMSGKQRPTLPPRISTAKGISTMAALSTATPAAPAQSAPLPDPEAKTDPSSDTKESITTEKAITQRLLQAVMLEVLDEYTGSFQATDQPSMSWTIRLREKHEPRRVLPNRPTETQRWNQNPDLKTRDEILVKLLKLSKDLNLDINKETSKLIDPASVEDTEVPEQPESDYPTSPSQIPFPTSGLILLFAAQNFATDITGLTTTPPLTMDGIRPIFRATFAPSQDLPHPPSLSQTDALLSLIYTILQSPLSQPTPIQDSTLSSSSPTSTIDLPFLTNLTNLFVTSPDPQVRDSTHHITTILLHSHTSEETKLLYLKSLLSPNTTPPSPIHEIQQGNLRALAINWLKDEFLAFSNNNNNHDTTNQSEPLPIPTPTPTATITGLNPLLLNTDPDLPNLIFPPLPTPPGPFITGQPAAAASSSSNTDAPPMSTDDDLESLLLQIPAHIASLNLLTVLEPNDSSDSESVLTSHSKPLYQIATTFLAGIAMWKDTLLALSAGIVQNSSKDDHDQGPIGMADIYALEDAVGRAQAVLSMT